MLLIRKKIKEFQLLDHLELKEQKDFVRNNPEKFKEFEELRDLIEDLYNLFNNGVDNINELFDDLYFDGVYKDL